ncbi:MAG: hypothetical protein U5L45_13685 [Saprospiraceae bacterium]|nr:hypothetical protein [Saprospiraceae bacterium]
MRSLRSRKGRRGGSFFGQRPKNEPHSPFSRERSEREKQQLRFYVWFQIDFYSSLRSQKKGVSILGFAQNRNTSPLFYEQSEL